MKRAARISVAFVVVVAAVGVTLTGWNQYSSAQVAGRPGSAAQSFSGFDALLAKHGDKSMNLAVTIQVTGPKIDVEEIIGQYVYATDSFLVLKMPNQQDLNFITWDHVLWVTGRPSK